MKAPSTLFLAEGEGIEPSPFPGRGFRDRLTTLVATLLKKLAEGERIELSHDLHHGYGLASRRITALPPFRRQRLDECNV